MSNAGCIFFTTLFTMFTAMVGWHDMFESSLMEIVSDANDSDVPHWNERFHPRASQLLVFTEIVLLRQDDRRLAVSSKFVYSKMENVDNYCSPCRQILFTSVYVIVVYVLTAQPLVNTRSARCQQFNIRFQFLGSRANGDVCLDLHSHFARCAIIGAFDRRWNERGDGSFPRTGHHHPHDSVLRIFRQL